MKTHYEVLGLDPSADIATIKKAFRREIARYHPDKVIHLGQEFQEMAATRAAELTVAYKTLTDDGQRMEYDVNMINRTSGSKTGTGSRPAATSAHSFVSPDAPITDFGYDPPSVDTRQFDTERAGRDVILQRAMTDRVRAIVEDMYGKVETPSVRGFDLVMVPIKGPRLLSATPPRVLIKLVDAADGAAVNEGWANAMRARVHVPKSPLIVLLLARKIAGQGELLRAVEALTRQPKAADGPSEIAVVIVDTGDWSARLPPGRLGRGPQAGGSPEALTAGPASARWKPPSSICRRFR